MQIKINIDDLFPRQEEIINQIINIPSEETKIHIIRSPRQVGKTELLIRLILAFIAKPKTYGGIVSASWDQYQELLTKFLNLCPEEIIANVERSKDLVHFVNGSKIHFYTGKNPDRTRGPSFDFLILDEAAIYPKGAIDVIVATTTARKNAKIIIASTPKGKNDFWRYSQMARDGKYVKEYIMTCYDNPYYDHQLLKEMRKAMPDLVFRQEYMGEFVFGKGAVFGEFAHLQKVDSWGEPEKGKRYFFAVDVAGGGGDSTILTIVDETGKIVFIYEATASTLRAQAQEIVPYIARFNAEGFVEANGLGLGFLQDLQEFWPKTHKFWMYPEKKQEIITTALKEMAEGIIKLPSIDLFPKLDNEMVSYQVSRLPSGKLQYSHPDGLHDDCVDSWLIANYAKNYFVFDSVSMVKDFDEVPRISNPTTLDIQNYQMFFDNDYS